MNLVYKIEILKSQQLSRNFPWKSVLRSRSRITSYDSGFVQNLMRLVWLRLWLWSSLQFKVSVSVWSEHSKGKKFIFWIKINVAVVYLSKILMCLFFFIFVQFFTSQPDKSRYRYDYNGGRFPGRLNLQREASGVIVNSISEPDLEPHGAASLSLLEPEPHQNVYASQFITL
jgi:hypothetical protein